MATHAKTALDRRVSKHQAFQATCQHCGVAAYLTTDGLLKRLYKGFNDQNLQVMTIPGKPEGTPAGVIIPLVKLLKQKGFTVL